MSTADYLFIHPLLGNDEGWAGYLVEHGNKDSDDGLRAGLCSHPLLAQFDRRHPWFMPAQLCQDMNSPLNERSVVIFPAKPEARKAESLKVLEEGLRKNRQKLGLICHPDIKLPGTGTWDYVMIENSHARTLPPYALVGLSSRTMVIAQSIRSRADHNWLINNACSLSTTEFLATHASGNKKADTTRIKLLELLGLIANDADSEALEAVFRQEPKLSYSMLRLVNSAAMAPRSPITSFAQAINLLGRRQLQRWLQLLVYADPNNGQHPNPLLQKAAARGRLMELLAVDLKNLPAVENLGDTAFMIGAFSLLTILLSMSIKEILLQLPLSDIVCSALAEQAGPLGQLLAAIEAAETRDLPKASGKLMQLGISSDAYRDAQLNAFSWASRIHPAA